MAVSRKQRIAIKEPLPSSFENMVETMAQRLHEFWAGQRRLEGWTYGKRRNDTDKTHPYLVPYGRLPVSEKKLNKAIADEALRTALSLGVVLSPNPLSYRSVSRDGSHPEEKYATDIPALLKNWRTLSEKGESLSPAIYEAMGQAALQKGSPLIAYDIFSAALARYPQNPRLQTLLGLALAETGAPERAAAILTELYDSGRADTDTIGILARTYKDLAWITGNPIYLDHAYKLYFEGYRAALAHHGDKWLDQAIYTGVNAAATALLAGKTRKARALAREVYGLSEKILAMGEENYWTVATLAETALILARWDQAEERYQRAGEVGRGKYRKLASTRRQARRLLQKMGEDPARFDHCFNLPSVVVFSGHMIDLASRKHPRFPAELENKVRHEIFGRLKELNAGVGFSSAACGSDILFISFSK
jgi:hypothetical protein